jgi:5,10-methylenetetrahydromethanopterin reductase
LDLPSPEVVNAVDDLAARARIAADAGLASLWLGQMYDIDALTAVALIGREVTRVTLGTAVTTTYSRHPITMSSQAKTTQAATGGRLTLGIGVSHQRPVEQRYGYSFDRPARHMREYLTALLPLLRGDGISFHGRTLTADTAGFSTRVAGSTPPPVLIAALVMPWTKCGVPLAASTPATKDVWFGIGPGSFR